jgi:hypothetical protein
MVLSVALPQDKWESSPKWPRVKRGIFWEKTKRANLVLVCEIAYVPSKISGKPKTCKFSFLM